MNAEMTLYVIVWMSCTPYLASKTGAVDVRHRFTTSVISMLAGGLFYISVQYEK